MRMAVGRNFSLGFCANAVGHMQSFAAPCCGVYIHGGDGRAVALHAVVAQRMVHHVIVVCRAYIARPKGHIRYAKKRRMLGRRVP